MAKKIDQKNKEKELEKEKSKSRPKKSDDKKIAPILTNRTKRWIKATSMFLIGVIVVLSFWDKAGRGGKIFFGISRFLIGQTVFVIPFLFILAGLIFLKPKQRGKFLPIFIGIFIVLIGVAGLLGAQNLKNRDGGIVGYWMAWITNNVFSLLVSNIVFGAIVVVGLVIFLQSVWRHKILLDEEKEKDKKSLFSWIMHPQKPLSIKVKEAGEKNEINRDSQPKIFLFKNEKAGEVKTKTNGERGKERYVFPPIDLLSKNEGSPTSGNIKQDSMIIKKTLENFGIPVEMTEANVGPTVTQYAFKPAEGVKLSKITTLSNNLALALAAHPIRIEAPIPGKSLVGIEVPNKVRSIVSLRNLIANTAFHDSSSPLTFVLGRNVSGMPMYADLAEMPHLLVAGSTGTGKTIYLNSLILSFLYRNAPSMMKFILIDPKRVEFQHYNHLPHLLCPVIYDASKTINALNWLVGEMQRRFEIFSEVPTRNIDTYNKTKSIIDEGKTLPYIILIIDELADLMAAKGREIEAGVVRLAQMARATGIHLVLATQRPSVEVITGLIKANITSRITFQVASQVDSRTVLDMAGAEKLLGLGDMLFVSAKTIRPRRIQGPYVPEADVKRVTEFIGSQNGSSKQNNTSIILSQSLIEHLESDKAKEEGRGMIFDQIDSLYEESKKIILETKKASASFLQRRLRIGYARAARLIDMLEERGIVGPADGAKPREVYGQGEKSGLQSASGPLDGPEEEPEPARHNASDALGGEKKEGENKDDEWKSI